MPLSIRTQALGRKLAAHLLRRATYGATKEDIDRFAEMSPEEAIEELYTLLPEPLPPIDPQTGETWVDKAFEDNMKDGDHQNYFKRWWLGLMLGAGSAGTEKLQQMAREKLVFFLHTHFTTIENVVNNSRALYFQNVLLRQFSQDSIVDEKVNFKELTLKICLDNAMILLLDGRLNVKGRPNENFAREFMELYTIGKGLPGHFPRSGQSGDYYFFTEQDVQAAAKVFSGYDLDNTFSNLDPDINIPQVKVKIGSSLAATQHDNSVKQFSHRLGSAIVTPNPLLLVNGQPTRESMLDELWQLIEIIFAQEETAKNICRKLYRFFVYHEIDDTIENTIIPEMVSLFTSNGYKIEPVIKVLLCSNHFYNSSTESLEDDQPGSIIKSPLDLISATLNFFNTNLPDPYSDTENFYRIMENILIYMRDQGLDFLNPYDVAGYDAYHQYPFFNRNWISSNTIGHRYKFIQEILAYPENMGNFGLDIYIFTKANFEYTALDPDSFIKEVISYLLPMSTEGSEITLERIEYFKSQFYKIGRGLPQGPVAFWQYNWTHAEQNETSREDVRGMLQDFFNSVMQSPEYQLF